MTNYIDKVKKEVLESLKPYDVRRTTYSEEELEEFMGDVVEFYSNHPSDVDVYRRGNNCILLIHTPKEIKDKEGNIINKPQKYESSFSDTQYLLRNCSFKIHGEQRPISIFASKETWASLGNFYDKKAFALCSQLKKRYSRLGDLGENNKPVILPELEFLKRHELDSLNDLDDSEYVVYYTANVTQFIL